MERSGSRGCCDESWHGIQVPNLPWHARTNLDAGKSKPHGRQFARPPSAVHALAFFGCLYDERPRTDNISTKQTQLRTVRAGPSHCPLANTMAKARKHYLSITNWHWGQIRWEKSTPPWNEPVSDSSMSSLHSAFVCAGLALLR